MGKLLAWSTSIVNHFWYCCRTCNGDVKLLKVVLGIIYVMYIVQVQCITVYLA